MTLLEARGLRKTFALRSPWLRRAVGSSVALDGVDLDLRAGETLALVGESGSGKTTLGRSLLRLVEPDDGELRFRGEDLRALRPLELRRRRRDLQMVFQDPGASLDPRQRIGDAVFEPLRIHRLAPRADRSSQALRLLAEVGLTAEVLERHPHELSGGQRQRVAIARALATRPALVVADEPVSALDVSIRGQILNLLADRQRELGLALLLIAHDLLLVGRVADRIAVLLRGRIVEEGEAGQVLARPLHPHTRALLAAIPGRQRRARGAGGVVRRGVAVEGWLGGCAHRASCPLATERCGRETPALVESQTGHRVACFRPGEGAPPERDGGGTFALDRRSEGRR